MHGAGSPNVAGGGADGSLAIDDATTTAGAAGITRVVLSARVCNSSISTESVPVIDLTVTTWNWLQTIKWQDYFALGTDHTHTNPKGADIVSGFVRDAVKAQVPELAKYLR